MKNIFAVLLFFMFHNAMLAQDGINCKIYHNGYFEFDGKHSQTIIYRENNFQIEYNTENDEWVTIKLNWVNDCKYSFTYINTNMASLKQYIGHSLEVDIVSGDSDGYTYQSIYKKGKMEFDGKIIFLETAIGKSIKKKIKKKLNKTKT